MFTQQTSTELIPEHARANMRTLAAYLSEHVTDAQFDMKEFRRSASGAICPYVSRSRCGSIGCALGWAPFALDIDDDIEIFAYVIGGPLYWYRLSRKYFVPKQHRAWDFCFAQDWKDHDNTREGAANRLEYAADNPAGPFPLPWDRA